MKTYGPAWCFPTNLFNPAKDEIHATFILYSWIAPQALTEMSTARPSPTSYDRSNSTATTVPATSNELAALGLQAGLLYIISIALSGENFKLLVLPINVTNLFHFFIACRWGKAQVVLHQLWNKRPLESRLCLRQPKLHHPKLLSRLLPVQPRHPLPPLKFHPQDLCHQRGVRPWRIRMPRLLGCVKNHVQDSISCSVESLHHLPEL